MPQSAKIVRPEAEETEQPYPPCLYSSAEEKRLYQRLKDTYVAHYSTWDDEACEAWPYIVEHASLAPSTIGKITNHSITRHLISTKVTWAHVVALRIIYKGFLFKSKKIMKLIRAKYPRINFSTFAYSEEYTRPLKPDEEGSRPEKPAQNKKVCVTRELKDETKDVVGKAPLTAPREANETMSRYLNERDKTPPVESDAPYFSKTKPKSVIIVKTEEEKSHTAVEEGEGTQCLIPTSLGKRKRVITENANDEGSAETKSARKLPAPQQERDKSRAATESAPDPPETLNEVPDTLDVAEGSSGRTKGPQDMSMDRFIEELKNHGNYLVQNTKALEKNTEILERLTEQLNARRKRS